MTGPTDPEARRRTLRLLIPLAILALAAKLVLSWNCVGTSDIESWKWFLLTLRKQGGMTLLLDYPQFNHPPFVLRLLEGIQWLRSKTQWPLPFCIRLPAILADVGSLFLAWRILAPRLEERALRTALALIALAPASVMISGYHGNTDPVMVCFLLLCALCLERPRWLWLAGVAMGMAASIKIVPVMLWPFVFLHLRGVGRRALFFGATLATMFVAWLPYSAVAPWPIVKKMLAYKSLPGVWGVSRILHGLPAPLDGAYGVFAEHGVIVLGALLLAVSIWLALRRASAFEGFGRVIATFLAATPGMGVQYLAWLVPWAGIAGRRAAIAFHATSGIFLFLVYSRVTDALPWRVFGYGEGDTTPLVPEILGLLCWAVIVWIALAPRREPERPLRVDG